MAGKEMHQHTEQEDYDLHRKPRRSDNEEGEQDRKREDQQTTVPTLNLELNIDDSRTQLQSSTHQNTLQSSNNTGNVFGRQANLEHQIRIGNPEKTSSSDDAAAIIVLTRQDAANHSNYLQQSNEEPTDGEDRDNEVEDRQLEQHPFTHREDSVSSMGPTSLPDLNIEDVIDPITSDEMVGLTDLVVTDDEEHNIETRRIIAVAEVEAELLEDDRDIIEIGASAHLLVTQPPLVMNETAGETVLQSGDEIVERQRREMEQRDIEEGIIPEVLEDDRDMIEVGTNAALSLRYVSAEEQQENCVDRAVLNPNVEDIHNMVEAGTSVFEQVDATPQISNTHPSSERALNVEMETSSNVDVHVATSDEICSASDAATPVIEGVTSTGDDAIPAPYVGDLDRGATVGLNQPRDAGDYYDPTTPIQIIAIDDYGTVGTLRYPEYDHKLELDRVPDDVRIRDMFYQLVSTYHEQPSYRTELCSLLESCQTDGLWPDIPENEDATITANVQDYFEQFQTSLVNLCEGHLTDCREEAQSILSLLCSNRVRLSGGCLVGVLEFQNKAFGHFLAVFLSGKLASCLKLAIFRGEFFSKFKCPADLNIDGEILSLDAQQEAEKFLKMLIGQHLKVQVFIKYKQIQECISGASTELNIKISVEQNMHQPEMERHRLLNQLKVDLDINPELKAVFMLCYPEIDRTIDSNCVLFDKAKHTDNTLLEDNFLRCSVTHCSEKRSRLKMLPCQHRVCAVCMKKMEKEHTEKKCAACKRDHEEVIPKTVIECPICRKVHVSGCGFEDCQQSTFIADTINHPHYPRSVEARQELKVFKQKITEIPPEKPQEMLLTLPETPQEMPVKSPEMPPVTYADAKYFTPPIKTTEEDGWSRLRKTISSWCWCRRGGKSNQIGDQDGSHQTNSSYIRVSHVDEEAPSDPGTGTVNITLDGNVSFVPPVTAASPTVKTAEVTLPSPPGFPTSPPFAPMAAVASPPSVETTPTVLPVVEPESLAVDPVTPAEIPQELPETPPVMPQAIPVISLGAPKEMTGTPEEIPVISPETPPVTSADAKSFTPPIKITEEEDEKEHNSPDEESLNDETTMLISPPVQENRSVYFENSQRRSRSIRRREKLRESISEHCETFTGSDEGTGPNEEEVVDDKQLDTHNTELLLQPETWEEAQRRASEIRKQNPRTRKSSGTAKVSIREKKDKQV